MYYVNKGADDRCRGGVRGGVGALSMIGFFNRLIKSSDFTGT